jgi:formamidopyrimidine-DNA glycosylase
MPEGPEVWILSEAINKFYHCEKTRAYGKHLFLSPPFRKVEANTNTNTDTNTNTNFGSAKPRSPWTFSKQSDVVSGGCGLNWSFGLTGKIQITDDNTIIKLNSGWIYGDQIEFHDYDEETRKLGTNWLTSSAADLHKIVDGWIKSKKKLAGLILDQTKISGIGVAWGSEILFKAGLRPDMRACDQVLTKGSGALKNLVDSMIEIRDKVKKQYSEYLDELNCKEFINDWFENLYEIRDMEIYQKGSKLEVLGRSWWV